MTDLELTKLCAEAMGWKHLGAVGIEPPKRGEPDPKGLWCLSGGNDWWLDPEGHHVCGPCESIPDPLHDDAQCMALVKKMKLSIRYNDYGSVPWEIYESGFAAMTIAGTDLNYAICECVAKMQSAKRKA